MSGTIHVQAVEMKTGRLVSQLVVNLNDNVVADIGSDNWKRPLAIDANCWSNKSTVWIGINPGDVEVVDNVSGD
jgi:hypothetical protein